jgi:hypothetical protein
VAKGYRGEDQALKMDRKVGESFWSAQKEGKLAKLTSKQTNKKTTNKQTNNKQTHKQTTNTSVTFCHDDAYV